VSRLRVLHAPSEIAGQPSILARALRDLGVEAWSLATNPTFAAYHPDESPGYDDMPPLPRYAGYAGLVARHLLRHDVFHFHFGRTLIPPHNLDLPLYRALGKKLVFHFHGCDVRNRAHMTATHRWSTCTECDPFCIPARQQRVLGEARAHAHARLVSTPDLLESVPGAEQVHVAAWLPDYEPQPFRETPRLVLHAPTNRLIKGTKYVEAAFERLRPRYPGVEFRTVERMPWRELRDLMAQCDVLVDQVFMGWYGMVAVEAMAMARPALAYLRPEFEPRAAGCPLVRITADSLEHELAALLDDAPRRRALGEAGRAWVEREHDAHVIARRLVALYQRIGAA
jgi:glycosyltransferase involved in cell wall biosynthesis